MIQKLAEQHKQNQKLNAERERELEIAKEERELMKQKDQQFNSNMQTRLKREKKVEIGEAPRQLNVLKEQYARMLEKIK